MKPSDIYLLKALAVEPRARIISLLCGKSLCAGALAKILGITPGALSQHLNVLKDSGLVVAEKRSYYLHYRISQDARERARKALDSLFSYSENENSQAHNYSGICSCPKHKTASKRCSKDDLSSSRKDKYER